MIGQVILILKFSKTNVKLAISYVLFYIENIIGMIVFYFLSLNI